ncbi:endonuclease [Streptomyces sp. SID5785]|uniref:Z1 domain-containing protein n=1 Tax=Streptomyces sp. SID5785 TaxID=2690309 RepID=UPI001361CCBC|nr:Z1 domain-containing protein [Streptomyces sp. SID5785]MZD05789.1 endonuclease [Streptomyces sp. SID5785]
MTTEDALLKIHTNTLAGMGESPRHFGKFAAFVADEDHPDEDLGEDTFRARLLGGDEQLAALWARHLNSWDFAQDASWAPGSGPRTRARRDALYDRLCLGTDLRKVLDSAMPVSEVPAPTVITREFTPWYTPERAAARSFYWQAYEEKLRAKGWSPEAIAGLDEASRAVVERLSDPEQSAARQAKGLVVGYVQSGKTANFTGVTAKAIDAGYRLVIVLGGTLNLLRAQTQRRLDMELIGQENILRGADPDDVDSLVGVDYVGDEDPDWPNFVSHGGRPSAHGAFDIERLTTRDNDYKSLTTGIRALEYEKRDPSLPLTHPSNLHHAAARVMVVKKNKAVLSKLVKDLKQIKALLGEIPTLIIDDESDQASVNTSNPKKWAAGSTERTAINAQISQLLGLLPRAQYVGYTATPFANVFVDPSDGEDIFPSDFLISLPRPVGYMGVQDFHDLDNPVPFDERDLTNSKEKAHVRGIYADSGGDDRLQEALDAFLLTGALKLYRAAHGVPAGPFRHHTMLVHESVRTDDHAELALRINTMWHESGHASTAGQARLRSLYERDFGPVSAAQAPGLPTPGTYEELQQYVSGAKQRIASGGRPVLVVNGDSDRYFDQLDLDFNGPDPVWKILVGGTKLSRGFTVEGLTVTYYRRTTRQADTLMQMGRWFGFRPGYQDLVRLYIGREETYGRERTADLYEAFEGICRDEELFREQLSRYAELVDGKPQLTPSQVPPLVSQHLSWVRPAAANKMFNAELVEVRSPGVWVEPTAYPEEPESLRHNARCWEPVLGSLDGTPVSLAMDSGPHYHAQVGTITHAQLLTVLCELRWSAPERFSPHLEFLLSAAQGDHAIDDWFVIAPMQTSARRREARILGHGPFSLARRNRRRGNLFGAVREPRHVAAAKRLAGASGLNGNATIEDNRRPRRGALVLYPVVESEPRIDPDGSIDPRDLVMAFAFVAPASAAVAGSSLVRFRALDSGRSDAAIIDRAPSHV